MILNFGIINIDKPSGPTSFDVSDFVRKELGSIGVKKTSHFGTLDPMVSGVLPIALNRACKLTGFFLGEDKEYVGIMRIHEDIPLSKLKEAIKEKFLGRINQMPPVRSRVKRAEREREIKKFEILEEIGLEIKKFVKTFSIQRKPDSIEHVFACRYDGDPTDIELDNSENTNYGWYDTDEMEYLDIVPNLIEYITLAFTGKKYE